MSADQLARAAGACETTAYACHASSAWEAERQYRTTAALLRAALLCAAADAANPASERSPRIDHVLSRIDHLAAALLGEQVEP